MVSDTPERLTQPASVAAPFATVPAAVTILRGKPRNAGPAPPSREAPLPAPQIATPAVYGGEPAAPATFTPPAPVTWRPPPIYMKAELMVLMVPSCGVVSPAIWLSSKPARLIACALVVPGGSLGSTSITGN